MDPPYIRYPLFSNPGGFLARARSFAEHRLRGLEVSMLEQVTMIEKVREVCEQDERVMGALMYGSFALGQGDRFSDIEFYLFFQDRVLDEVDEEAWVAQIAPVELYYVNEFGNGTAVFETSLEASSTLRRPPTSTWSMLGRVPGSCRWI
jgi:lincosamide nucleotidyltransferase